MRFAERAQHLHNPGIRDIVFHVAGTVPGDPVSFFFSQAQIQLIGNNREIIKKVPDLSFNRLNQVILIQKSQSCVPCPLNLCFRFLLQFFTGQFQKPVGKHPVSGSRHVQCIAHIEKDHFLVFQQIEHILSPLMKCIS